MEIVSILLVEDEELFARALETKLAAAGYRVTRARDGKEALRFFDSQTVSVVLIDLTRFEQESLELIAEFRRINPAVKTIAMSGGGMVEAQFYLSLARRFGAIQTLVKPFSVDKLLVAIRSVLKS